MRYDLHVHSTYSDGIKTPEQLAQEAVAAGLGGFALTDHDTIDGWKAIPFLERKYPIVIFPGVELSTEWEGRDVHILGYAIKETEPFRQALHTLADARRQRIARIIESLAALGLFIDPALVEEIAGEGTVGRPHVAEAMVRLGYVKDKQRAFDRYLNRGKPAYVERMRFTPMEAVTLIRKCGGHAVLAHPGLDHAIDAMGLLREYGLEGLEVHHSSHTVADSAKFSLIAREHGLAETAGSDYHGHSKNHHGLIGSVAVEEERLPVFLTEYLKEHLEYVERI